MRTFHTVTVLTMMFTSHKSRAIKLQVMRSHLKVSELQPMHIHVQLDVQDFSKHLHGMVLSLDSTFETVFNQRVSVFICNFMHFSSGNRKKCAKKYVYTEKLGEQDDSSKSPGLPIILAHQRPLFFSLQEISHTFATV